MLIKLTNDFVFKYVFGRESSKPILLEFINAVLTDVDFTPIASVTLKNPVNLKSADFLKESILDIRAQDAFGAQFDIEIQIAPEKSFINRSLYYWSQLYSSQLDKGVTYGELKPAVCINLTDFTVFPTLKRFHNCFMLHEIHDKEYILSEDLAIHFIELTKTTDAQGALADWLRLILESGEKEDEMTILLKKNPMLKQAHDAYLECLEDREAREMALSRERFLRDQFSREKSAKEEGKLEGIAEGELKGKLEGKLETARSLKTLGTSVEIIAQSTGLTQEEIEKL